MKPTIARELPPNGIHVQSESSLGPISIELVEPIDSDLFDSGGKRVGRAFYRRKETTTARPPKKTPCGQKIKGAVKMAQAELGINQTQEDVIEQRKAECQSCPHNDIGRCTECGCFLWSKIRIKGEKCPVGKW